MCLQNVYKRSPLALKFFLPNFCAHLEWSSDTMYKYVEENVDNPVMWATYRMQLVQCAVHTPVCQHVLKFLPGGICKKFLPGDICKKFLPCGIYKKFLPCGFYKKFLPCDIYKKFLPCGIYKKFLPCGIIKRSFLVIFIKIPFLSHLFKVFSL